MRIVPKPGCRICRQELDETHFGRGRGRGFYPVGQLTPHALRRRHGHRARVDEGEPVHGQHGLAPQEAPIAHERHGLGEGVEGRRDPARNFVHPVPAADQLPVGAPSTHLACGHARLPRLRCGHDAVAVGCNLVYLVEVFHVERLILLYAFDMRRWFLRHRLLKLAAWMWI